jgi:hypothetical protein
MLKVHSVAVTRAGRIVWLLKELGPPFKPGLLCSRGHIYNIGWGCQHHAPS